MSEPIFKADHSQDLYSEVGMCNARCKTCFYGTVQGKQGMCTCAYIVETGHRRPCPAGKGCTEFVARNGRRRTKNVQCRNYAKT